MWKHLWKRAYIQRWLKKRKEKLTASVQNKVYLKQNWNPEGKCTHHKWLSAVKWETFRTVTQTNIATTLIEISLYHTYINIKNKTKQTNTTHRKLHRGAFCEWSHFIPKGCSHWAVRNCCWNVLTSQWDGLCYMCYRFSRCLLSDLSRLVNTLKGNSERCDSLLFLQCMNILKNNFTEWYIEHFHSAASESEVSLLSWTKCCVMFLFTSNEN